jgi:hypothetical protein
VSGFVGVCVGFIRSPKDFWIGLIYLAFGIAVLSVGWDYRLGTAGRMGPGYFPKVLAWLMIGLGVISLMRALAMRGEPVDAVVATSVGVSIFLPASAPLVSQANTPDLLAAIAKFGGGPWVIPALLAALAVTLAVFVPASRPLMLISLACALFGWLLPRVGLSVALLALCLVSASASREFRFDAKATAGLIALVVFCAAVFVKGLGVPMPLWGTWLEPFVAGLPAWMK